MTSSNYAHPEVLVTTTWAADHLEDTSVRFVEVDVDTTAYESGHIPGAVGWNWQRDTQDQLLRDIPNKADFEALMSRSGIAPDTTVVLYGDNNNWFATYAFWLLKLYGHQDVHLIDGGRKKWVDEGRPLSTEPAQVTPTNYTAREAELSLRALRADVLTHLENPEGALVDVRSPDEFAGRLLAPPNMPQEGSQRGGHIPGAVNIVWARAVNEDGTFRPYEELVELYGGNGVTAEKDVITYCRIGERSSHTWFVLSYLLGYPKVRNYDGSWTEWGSSVGMPIEKEMAGA
jgi:thiosulfate/3-mercaptopyruvate sulfurtransferase